MPSIQITGLRHEFGSHRLFDDLSVEVNDGEYLVLLGESGSGKTTLLEFIAGLFHANLGGLHVHGRAMKGIPPHRRDIAYCFQQDALYPHLSVRKNIMFGSDSTASLDHIAAQTRITSLLDRKPGQLSGGEKKRVSLAKSLFRETKILLLDEPLSAIDASHRKDLVEDLRAYQSVSRATMLHVTHDAEEAFRLADRVAILHEGKIQQIDSPSRVLADPSHLSSARMMLGYQANEFVVRDGSPNSQELTLQQGTDSGGDASDASLSDKRRIIIPASAIRVIPKGKSEQSLRQAESQDKSTSSKSESRGPNQPPTRTITLHRESTNWIAPAEWSRSFTLSGGHEILLRAGQVSFCSHDIPSADSGRPNVHDTRNVEISVDANRIFWFAPDGSRFRAS